MSYIQTLINLLNRHDIPQKDIDRAENDLAVALNKNEYLDDHQEGRMLKTSDWDLFVFIPPKEWGMRAKVELTLLPKHHTHCSINQLIDGKILSTRSIGGTVDTAGERCIWGEKYGLYPVKQNQEFPWLSYTKGSILRSPVLDAVIIEIAANLPVPEIYDVNVHDAWANGTGYFDAAGKDERVHGKRFFTFIDNTGRRGVAGHGYVVAQRYTDSDTVLIGHNFNRGRDGDVYFAADCLNAILSIVYKLRK